MQRFVLAALAAAILAGPGTACAQGGARAERARQAQEAMREALFDGIELDADQKTRVNAIHGKYQALRQEARASAPGGRRERRRPDSATVARLRELAEQERGEVRAVLTPEQQARFDENARALAERARERRGRGGAAGGP